MKREHRTLALIAIIDFILALVLAVFAGYVEAAAPPVIDGGEYYINVEQIAPVKVEISRDAWPYQLTDAEIWLTAQIVHLEAGGEGMDLQRGVAEVIFRRLDSGIWGTTISEVIFAANQFSVIPMLNANTTPSEATVELVRDICERGCQRTPARVLFFRTDYYHRWDGAVAEYCIGNVYFSSSRWITKG